jgi:hypothetical protein
VHLLKLPESRRENETADGISVSICAMGVKFTACIAFGDVEAR